MVAPLAWLQLLSGWNETQYEFHFRLASKTSKHLAYNGGTNFQPTKRIGRSQRYQPPYQDK